VLKKLLIPLAAVAVLLVVAPAGNAAVSFGSLRTTNDPNEGPCEDPLNSACSLVQFIVPTNPNGDQSSAGAPIDGVITKFRIRAFGDGGPAQVTFRLADITLPDPNNADNALATAAGTGPTVTVPEGTGDPTPTTQAPARLPVKKGQHLAIDASMNIRATYDASGSKFSYVFVPPLVDGQGARGSNAVVGELLMSADVEPDADHDGFGDETQDQCPTQATTQGPCDTAAPAVSGLRVSGGKIFYTLSEGATVSFKLEKALSGRKVAGKCVRQTRRNRHRPRCTRFTTLAAGLAGPGAVGANQLAIPKFRGRKLGAGSYRLTMTVTDAAGNSATTTKSFRIKPPHKKKKHHH
jgi:hypothetical protein